MHGYESISSFLQATLDVKFFAKMDFGVEEQRPSHCPSCGCGAGRPGALRLHGHGVRTRDVWGPPRAGGARPEVLELRVRRYRCLACAHVMTVRPPFVARYFRYATAAIALALWLWAVCGRPARFVRAEVSPWRIVGLSEPRRWRSLSRWFARHDTLFGFRENLVGEGRELARRVAHLLFGRAPPTLQTRERVFVGAQLR